MALDDEIFEFTDRDGDSLELTVSVAGVLATAASNDGEAKVISVLMPKEEALRMAHAIIAEDYIDAKD